MLFITLSAGLLFGIVPALRSARVELNQALKNGASGLSGRKWLHRRFGFRDLLASHPLVRDKCLGVVLNKVAMNKLRFYESYGSEDYYSGRYAKYYHGAS